jgi:hypothetical protein
MVPVTQSVTNKRIVATYNLKGSNMNALPATNGQFGAYTRQHARNVNAKYNNAQANNVSWIDRWNQTLAQFPVDQRKQIISRLNSALKKFSRNHPGVKSFSNPKFRLCKSLTKRLTKILIDTTIQRSLDVDWVIKIIENFRPYQAQPLQIYKPLPKDLPHGVDEDTWSCWEGQHTGMALYLIGTMAFGLKANDIDVPTAEYDFLNREECRRTFMANNSKEGRKVLDSIDIISQQIFAVRLDGAQDPEWLRVNDKQTVLEQQDLFLTDSKFHDHTQPGAITRPGDLCDDKYSLEVVQQFATYATEVLANNPRPIDTKELPIIMGFLKMAAQDNVTYSDQDVRGLAQLCMDLFDADFNEAGFFWEKVNVAYINWHNDYHADMDESLRPGIKLNKDWAQGGTFFWHLLKKHWVNSDGEPMSMPKLNISTSFRPKAKDLSW